MKWLITFPTRLQSVPLAEQGFAVPTEAGDPRTYGPPGPEKWEYLVRPQATVAVDPEDGAVSAAGWAPGREDTWPPREGCARHVRTLLWCVLPAQRSIGVPHDVDPNGVSTARSAGTKP